MFLPPSRRALLVLRERWIGALAVTIGVAAVLLASYVALSARRGPTSGVLARGGATQAVEAQNGESNATPLPPPEPAVSARGVSSDAGPAASLPVATAKPKPRPVIRPAEDNDPGSMRK